MIETCGNERSKARNGEGADARKQTECTAEDSATGGTGGGTFRSFFSIFFVREFLRAAVIGQQHGDIVIRKDSRDDLIDGVLGLVGALINAEDCCVFTCHGVLLLIDAALLLH